MQTINDKKTISRLNDKIKELEILAEAQNEGMLFGEKDKQIASLERQIANLEASIELKDQHLKTLMQTKERNDIDMLNKHIEESKRANDAESKCKKLDNKLTECEAKLADTQEKLDAKEKMHTTYLSKIEILLEEKQELVEKVELYEKKESELNELVEQSKGNTSKKDKIYAKMLKMKERKVNKLSGEVTKLKNIDQSRQQTIEYLKKRIANLEKSSTE